ncbi:MAG: hypothetical protein PHG47_02170 [Sulfuricella sp.]|nr:hypothetical protein [Sulfuricella sp.]
MTATAIRHSELRSALEWYFESKNLAIKNALGLRCPLSPEQQKELRQYYSEYFVALVSTTELLCEPSYEFSTRFKEQLNAALSVEAFPDGKGNYDYIRELRNSIVHRGLDICSAAHVYEDRLLVVAPAKVFDRNGRKSFPAFGNYLIEIIAKCEETVGPLIAKHLEEVGLLKPLLTQDQAKAEASRYLTEAPAVPDWVKQNTSSFISQLDFVQVQVSAIEKLVGLLNFNALFAENDAQPYNAPDLARKAAQGR